MSALASPSTANRSLFYQPRYLLSPPVPIAWTFFAIQDYGKYCDLPRNTAGGIRTYFRYRVFTVVWFFLDSVLGQGVKHFKVYRVCYKLFSFYVYIRGIKYRFSSYTVAFRRKNDGKDKNKIQYLNLKKYWVRLTPIEPDFYFYIKSFWFWKSRT